MKAHASGCTSQRSKANGMPTRTLTASASARRRLGVAGTGNDRVPEGVDRRRGKDDREGSELHPPRRAALRDCDERGYALAPAGVFETTSRMRSSASERFSRELA